ncbi:hypothetical protein F503_05426 [Ophiostoma piceae UAMH 11346]|uniref:Uv excision repair protein n=1 Tax=Ophiostoma piceae (strain UAMH 11346) TaxID=1262450 RepID=S3CE50_OPHP1|nr:hypothetical protein F503_05426 [Ophiostoma piceae UAMH 11346]
MAISSSIPAVLGSLAVFTTSALVAVHAILAHEPVSATSPSTNTLSLASSISEGAVLVIVSTHLCVHIQKRRQLASTQNRKAVSLQHSLWFGLSIVACTAAAAISVAALISLGKSANSLSDTIFGSSVVPFLAGASVTLGVCYAAQLFFLIVAQISARGSVAHSATLTQQSYLETGSGAAMRPSNMREKNRSPISSIRLKSIPYTQTSTPATTKAEKKPSSILSHSDRDSAYAEASLRSPPGSSSGRSVTETVHSLRTSLSHAIRPSTSRTRLIPSISGDMSGASSRRSSAWRPTSLAASSISPANTYASRERDVRPSVEDFDSWDTSAVDPQNRLTVLERTASPAGLASRFLETIPASPTTSRCPSPGAPFDLEPPRSRRRSRSYSPAPSMRPMNNARVRSHSQSQSPPPGEAHIHPLFRSDSPTPPPAVSAGTVVVAAPNGGRIMATDAQSLRTLSRMRSGSLPTVPSPLSRQGSFEDFGLRRGMALAERPHTRGSDCMDDFADEADRRSQTYSPERKMTPPIPEWILSAGTRTSLSDYQSRKVRVEDGAP